MNHVESFDAAFANFPLIAILRGVRPDEVEAIGDVLVAAGFTLIEVPLNSPDPLESISRLSRSLEGRALVGAGTVLFPEEVEAVEGVGGTLIISPNLDDDVVREASGRGLVALPGVATPSEAFRALRVGAAGLKLFPAEAASPAVLRAWRAVLPHSVKILPVGGISVDGMQPWFDAGASGFGLGSALYRSGQSSADVAANAAAFGDAIAARPHR